MDIKEQVRIIKKGAVEILPEEDVIKKLEKSQKTGKPLIIKFGMDPTAPDVHLGHTVALRKLKAFQDMGHQVVIIIGDYTGMIGDPTGRSEARKQLTREEVMVNAKTYETQVFKVLDINKTIVRFNSEWLAPLNFADVLGLSAKYTVARMLEREDFKKRFIGNLPISIHEFFYPLMQGYDSVALKADIELGGTDQKFNILMGRTLQKEYGLDDLQIGLFMPLLEGTDGLRKMSKSYGNYIGIDEEPDQIYGKTMSIPDEMIIKYFELVTDVHPDEIDKMKRDMAAGNVNPRDLKMRLAKELVRLYHGDEEAIKSEQNFISRFQSSEETIEEVSINLESVWVAKFLVSIGATETEDDAKERIKMGAVKINGEQVQKVNIDITPKNGDVIQIKDKKTKARRIIKIV